MTIAYWWKKQILSIRVECEIHSEVFNPFHIFRHRQCLWFREWTWTAIHVTAWIFRCANGSPMNIKITIWIGSNAFCAMRLTCFTPNSVLETINNQNLGNPYSNVALTCVCVQEYPSTLNTGTMIQLMFCAISMMTGSLDVNNSFRK